MIIVRIPGEYSAKIVIDESVLIRGKEEKEKRGTVRRREMREIVRRLETEIEKL